jgi:5-methylcytosine-specific restriction endonuclease McrA
VAVSAQGNGGASRPQADPTHQLSLSFDRRAGDRRPPVVSVVCRACRKRIRLPSWVAEQGLSLHFCDDACRKRWEQEAEQGPPVRLSGRPGFRGGNWEDLTARVRARDGGQCRRCGVGEGTLGRQLDVHHVVPFRMFRTADEANRIDNLIAVCPSCHKALEEDGRQRFPLFGDGTETRL